MSNKVLIITGSYGLIELVCKECKSILPTPFNTGSEEHIEPVCPYCGAKLTTEEADNG